jgi:hypothetical protein
MQIRQLIAVASLGLFSQCQAFVIAKRATGSAVGRPMLSRPAAFSLAMSSEINSEDRQTPIDTKETPNTLDNVMRASSTPGRQLYKLPPLQVDDKNLLFYDVFLIINLVVSISFWVVHRMSFDYIGIAFNEGCLLSLCWIVSGLFSGAFLDSAVDGHYGSTDERGGPKAAGMLAFQTFINTISLRLIFALAVAFVQHRQVGVVSSEQLIPLEVGFGMVLMSFWRMLHSSFALR